MKWKVATILLAAILLVVVALNLLAPGLRDRFSIRRANSASVITQVKQLKELATVRVSIQRVVGITEPKMPLGSESILLMVQGEVIAGVDLSELKPENVRFSTKNAVDIHLPGPCLLQLYLDEHETKVWDRHITWWTPWVPYDPDLEHKARLAALEEVKQAALKMGILDRAGEYARRAIRDLLSALGLQASFSDQAT